jgi:sugar lactone lactonase YvrE
MVTKEAGESVRVQVERIAGNRVDFEVVYRFGGVDRFVGYSDGSRVSWLTGCFVREFYGKLCGAPPAGAAGQGIPYWILPARFAHPTVPGLIRPQALAVEPDGSLLIADSIRNELFRRSPDGSLHAVAPIAGYRAAIAVAPGGVIYLGDGKGVHVLAHGSERTLPQRFSQVSSLAFARDGTLYVGGDDFIDAIGPNGSTRTVFHAGPKFDQIAVRGHRYAFGADDMTVGGNGDLFVFSFSTKQVFEITPHGTALRAWQTYAHGLATAPDGSIVIGTQFGPVQRIRDGKLSTVVDLGKGKPFGFPFQEDGIAVARDGTIFIDTLVGNGYTNQTALAAVTPDGKARLLRTTTPLAATLPRGMRTGCPSPRGLQPFDASAQTAAVRVAEIVDMPPFDRGLSLSDPSWWSGVYTDQIDGRYQSGRHHVYTVGPASADPYEAAAALRCGAALVRRSIAIVVGPGVYSDQVSHMFFLDRNARALLYWQHT